MELKLGFDLVIADLQSAAFPRKLPEKREDEPPLSPQYSPDGAKPIEATADPELARLLTAWPGLSEPIRRAIRALFESDTTR